jgi:ankyrin repeat protein
MLAAGEGHTLVVEQLIAAGSGLDVKDTDGYGPIYPAAMTVLYFGAGSRLLGRWTALFMAAGEGHTVVVNQLIAAGAGLDVKDNVGYEPIYPTATALRYPSRQPTRGQVHCAHLGHSNG